MSTTSSKNEAGHSEIQYVSWLSSAESCPWLSDVRLVAMDGLLLGHRLVLAASCSALRRAFGGQAEEDGPETLAFPERTLDEVRAFLDVVYGRRETLDESSVDADAVRGLMRECGFDWSSENVEAWHDDDDDAVQFTDDDLDEMKIDVETTKSKPPHRCPQPDCAYTSLQRKQLTQHVRLVHRRARCPHCQGAYSPATLSEHVARKHTQERRFACDRNNCDARFFNRNEREAHLSRRHGVQTDPVMCDACGAEFTSRVVYWRHQRACRRAQSAKAETTRRGRSRRVPYTIVLNKQDPHLCPDDGCGYRHDSLTMLKEHYRRKHERRTCPHCAKLVLFYSLGEHVATQHTAEADLAHACAELGCGRRFYNDPGLRRHADEAHAREERYVCDRDRCGRRFLSGRQLTLHKTHDHNRSKHHPCDRCANVYRHARSLKKHQLARHPDGAATRAIIAQ